MEATVCLGYLDLCQGVPWTVSVQIAAQAFRGKGSLARAAQSRPPGGQGRAAGHVYIVWWCAAELAPSATRQRRCGHRSNGLPRQSGVVAAASSPRPCGHRGRQRVATASSFETVGRSGRSALECCCARCDTLWGAGPGSFASASRPSWAQQSYCCCCYCDSRGCIDITVQFYDFAWYFCHTVYVLGLRAETFQAQAPGFNGQKNQITSRERTGCRKQGLYQASECLSETWTLCARGF